MPLAALRITTTLASQTRLGGLALAAIGLSEATTYLVAPTINQRRIYPQEARR